MSSSGTLTRADTLPSGSQGARFVELTPGDPGLWAVDQSEHLELLREFLTGAREAGAWEPAEPDRVLATLLFTDIVGSTERATELGDARWRDLVQRHHALVRQQLVRFRGREIDTAGDGFFASFDGPARAVRCACAIVEGVPEVGLDVRAGLHTRECELIDGKPGGVAVVVGARISSIAPPGKVFASSTVKDLVVGPGIVFDDRGDHELKVCPARGDFTRWSRRHLSASSRDIPGRSRSRLTCRLAQHLEACASGRRGGSVLSIRL